ncbi:MAG TPA: zinc ribbon domain-containing protein [Thermoplasmata archaeon]|nr:zinc ribbon domain-containing protein [Thermoplasmata archaeon]
MPVCPACGSENPESGRACARCGLAVELFEPVRLAVGLPESDPKFAHQVQEIVDALGAGASGGPNPPAAALLSHAARFPAPPAPTAVGSGVTGPALRPIQELPALPAAHGLAVARRQVEEYLTIARRQGIDTTEYAARARDAVAANDGPSFEVLGRSLFIQLAGSFTEEFETLVTRRNDLAGYAPTAGPDVEFESCRSALALGDLGGAQRRLRHLEETLSRLEDDWATVHVLTTQAELLAETIRELGGDPAPALGPLAEGRRLAKAGDRETAEPVLARAGLALWAILEPAFLADLARLKDRLLALRESGADVGPALGELREIASDLRRRAFVSVIGSYRRLRELVGPSAAAAPDASGPKL